VLATRVAAAASADPVDLIESLAHRIAATVLEDPRILSVRVTVHKPDAPITLGFQDVSVTIERSRDSAGIPVVIALGSNLGDREATLARAVAALGRLDGLSGVRPSPVVETVALTREGPDAARPLYLNQVVLAETLLPAEELLAALLSIEDVFGRERIEHWGDRTLDLDLISYGDVVQSDSRVTLPHPRAHKRDFVLAPWAMVDPDAVLPGRGQVADLLAAVDTRTLRVIEAPTD
jgi:dihydroneopterin aldolase/2-amino-4-hydroxy-6-hydroxymethyldihydropteridine diphosphokinase